MKSYFVYILASQRNGTLYIGVTTHIAKRLDEHKSKITPGFTSKYSIGKLVYFEQTESMETAIAREKQLKKWNRAWKIELIEKENPEWKDLTELL